jgi:hypothetical protein
MAVAAIARGGTFIKKKIQKYEDDSVADFSGYVSYFIVSIVHCWGLTTLVTYLFPFSLIIKFCTFPKLP